MEQKKIGEILSKYKEKSELIDILAEIQEEYGYLSEDNMREIERVLGIPLAEIYGVATFYAAFKLRPHGKHVIKVCVGTACHVKGADQIKEHIEETLKIKEGETTEDGLFTLECVSCIGACAKAPNIMIDDEVYGDLTKQKVDEILKRYR